MKKKLLLVIVIFAITSWTAIAQFKNYGIKGGVKYEQLIPMSEFKSDYSFIAKGFLGFELSNTMSLELGAGYGQYNTSDDYNPLTGTYSGFVSGTDSVYTSDPEVKTDIIPIDARLKFTPWAKTAKNWNPYFYLGAGVMHFKVKSKPDSVVNPQYDNLEDGWAGIFPAGLGTEIRLSNSVLMDLNAGVTYTTTDLLNNFVIPDFKDAGLNIGLGLIFGNFKTRSTDDDKDGLTNDFEQKSCTDYKNPDTDGDGLKDGDEVNQYKTDPCKKDTDGDKLSDGEEVLNYITNPLKQDSDSDKLNDYEEVKTYTTLPNDNDTDDDGLIDGDEVITHKTNPKMVDTDLGSIGDGVEVGRSTNPLNPDDDLPKAVEEKVKVGQTITLEGINFATNKWDITSLAEEKLDVALSSLKNNPNVEVEIIGYTDNTGSRNWNMELSQRRADSVKDWFVSKGISGSRITTIGMGPDSPAAPNDTEEGRYKNRRIDFKRIK